MKYGAIIFDLDGTLLDTLQDLALSVNAVLKEHGLQEHPVDAYRYYVGDGIDVLVERAFPALFIEEVKLDNIVRAVKGEYSRRWADHTVPYPGIPELLSFLQENSIPKAIFSNKPHEFALLTVETLLPDWDFVEIRGIGAETPRKPDPEGALRIAEMLGLEPGTIVYLGDTDTDMKTAVRGGFFPVGALWGFRPAAELKKGGAEFLAENPLDLVAIFK
jgi:phosphoglycolate phosphatase